MIKESFYNNMIQKVAWTSWFLNLYFPTKVHIPSLCLAPHPILEESKKSAGGFFYAAFVPNGSLEDSRYVAAWLCTMSLLAETSTRPGGPVIIRSKVRAILILASLQHPDLNIELLLCELTKLGLQILKFRKRKLV